MDIGKAFSYVFEDENWIKKILIGGVISAIPILNFAAVGYGLRVLNNVARGEEKPLPEWDNWGNDWVKGLLVGVAGFIYALPALILLAIGAIITAVAGDASGDVSGVAGVCLFGTNCLTFLWYILMALWMPGALIQYASKGEFGAFFQFGEIWALISKHLGSYGMAILTAILAGIVGGLGSIACVIGVIFTGFYSQMVSMHAFGQVAAEANPPAEYGPSEQPASF